MTSPPRAAALAAIHGARASPTWTDLIEDPDVGVVVIATPPSSHARIAIAALEAGRHVLCEKPLATNGRDAAAVVAAAVHASRVLVVDHVLRYNPILRALTRLRAGCSPPVQRYCFENDASDEDLPPEHWFWDEEVSGGIFLEHGVHFFDAAHLLVGSAPTLVQASAVRRPGPHPVTDLVSATCEHPGGVLATHTHGFSHAHRCEHQLMRIDHGSAEVRVDGWIPVDATVDAWTDDAGADLVAELATGGRQLLDVPGFRLGADTGVTIQVTRHAGPAGAHGRGAALTIPHHVRLGLSLGGVAAKTGVYRESVRAVMADLLRCAETGEAPACGGAQGLAAVLVAEAARDAARDGRTIRLGPASPPPPDAGPHGAQRVDKPWGHEEIFAAVEGAYSGKLLHVSRGESLSLQYHRQKDETIALLSGRVEIDIGADADHLRRVALSPGQSVHVTAGVLHRLRAVEDAVLVEASSAAPGWREDVVRIADRYGRSGNSGP